MASREKRRGGESKLTAFTLATELKSEHFAGWSASEAATLADPTAAMGTMLSRLTATGAEVAGFYGILHDRDTREVFDPIAGKYVKEPKFAHIHIVCYFTKREKGLTVSAIAKALGVETNMIEKPRSGRYAVDNLLAYLIHAKDKDKYQYQPEDVVTLVGDDYMDVWAKNRMAWERAAATKQKKTLSADVDRLVEEARWGRITHSQFLLDDELYAVYSLPANKPRIDAAIEAWGERRMAQAVADMEAGKFSTSVIYIYGKPGEGKSILARGLIRYWNSVNGWEVANLAASNAMDEYNGEEIILLDDVRGGAMSAEDWLKLLDGHNANAASARYRNKAGVAPRVVVIIANRDPLTFFYFARNIGGGDRSESVDTFLRRIGWFVQVLDPFDVGAFNCAVEVPCRMEAYCTAIGDGRNRQQLTGLTYGFREAEADTRFSPFGLAEFLARAVDAQSGRLIADRDDADEKFAAAAGSVYEAQLPAMQAGSLPLLPDPASGAEQKRNLRDVYENKFAPLWRDVFAADIAQGRKCEADMATFDDWVRYGCHDAWSEDRDFYRLPPALPESSEAANI